uniref:Uncharacterized protein n=1 Tax=Romanomermis culicivorax TaxID=13658 RepID=A0A915IIZ7_ROMCU
MILKTLILQDSLTITNSVGISSSMVPDFTNLEVKKFQVENKQNIPQLPASDSHSPYSVGKIRGTYSKRDSMLTSYNKRKYLCIALFAREIQTGYLVMHRGFGHDEENLVNL